MRSPESNAQIVEEAVKYIIFLVDADRLFDTALGMYDFSLVLMIAQHAQKVIKRIRYIQRLSNLFLGPKGIFTVPSRIASFQQILSTVQDR